MVNRVGQPEPTSLARVSMCSNAQTRVCHVRHVGTVNLHAVSGSSRIRRWLLGPVSALACGVTLSGAPVAVRQTEGAVHGFLALRTLEGATIADGDLIQFAEGDRVTTRLVFRFKDGSLHDETALYSQRREFRLLGDHLVQSGPSFPHPLDMTIEPGGNVVVRYTDDRRETKTAVEHLDLPP